MPARFAELAARSNFSFLEGASHPEEMVSEASELGLEAIAIADRDGLYGSARAHVEANKGAVRLVVAAELTLDGGESTDRELVSSEPVHSGGSPSGASPPASLFSGKGGRPERVVLLVEDARGYENLCQLLTLAHANHEKGTASIGIEAIAERNEGLTLLVPADASLRASTSLVSQGACDAFFEAARAFGSRVALAVHRHLEGGDAERTALAEAVLDRFGIGAVATARPLYHRSSRKSLADVVHCIRHKTTLDEAGRGLAPNAEARLRSPADIERLFRDRPHWVEASLEIAERCRFSLTELRYMFPSDELCQPGESPDQALRRLTEAGLVMRYGGTQRVPASVRAQIEKELTLIATIDKASYFLSVQEVVEMARSRRILCQGRGSAANSAVCYALGITAVDPARSNLLFERFLSAERNEPPDIDVDFEHERREEVIQAIYAKYGRDRSAMVSEIIAYRGKSAMREVGKVFGLALDQVDRLSQIVFRYDLSELTPARVAEQGLDPGDERIFQAVALAKMLEGAPRHLSIHVGGFVLSSESLSKVAPIEPARMEDRTVIPWDKDDLDTLGFFKVDVLALGMLTAIRKCLALVHALGRAPGCGADQPFDPIEALAAIPAEDPAVYEAIGHADTVGVFQIESRAQMSMLPRLKPKKFYDLVIEVAIVRPGPIQGGMVHPYLRRRTGQEAAVSPHPCLDAILERTLGVPLFQEQVMQIAMEGAGYSAGEADQLRRDMAAWKKHGRLDRHRDRLLGGFASRGISRKFGEQLFKQIEGFGEYGFPESHAASFALLVYSSAWLKVHHAAAFACSLLNSQPMGFYSPSSLVKDAQRHGVEVRPVCALTSEWDHTLEPCPTSTGGYALRLGLRLVSGLGESAGRAVVEARQAQVPVHVADLAHRANLKKSDVEALAEAGAFEAIIRGRREALWQAHAPRLPGLFDGVALEPDIDSRGEPRRSSPRSASRFKPHTPVEQLLLDYGRVGLSIHDHPMCHVRPHLTKTRSGRVLTAAALPRTPDGSRVEVAGLVVGRQRPQTASGVTFVTLEDETGVMNLVVTVSVWDAHRHAALHAKMLLVEGRLEREGEVIHVLVSKLERIELPNGERIATRSRDFH